VGIPPANGLLMLNWTGSGRPPGAVLYKLVEERVVRGRCRTPEVGRARTATACRTTSERVGEMEVVFSVFDFLCLSEDFRQVGSVWPFSREIRSPR
jgi:hypothetical protein